VTAANGKMVVVLTTGVDSENEDEDEEDMAVVEVVLCNPASKSGPQLDPEGEAVLKSEKKGGFCGAIFSEGSFSSRERGGRWRLVSGEVSSHLNWRNSWRGEC
jgi:hypothetical protein